MAFEYTGALEVLKAWMLSNLSQWYTTDAVFTYAPKFEDIAAYPLAMIQNARAVATMPGGLEQRYTLGIGFATRDADAKTAQAQLNAILKDFDSAWADEDKVLDPSFGNFKYRTQVDQPTNFSPAFDDKAGLVVYAAAKSVIIVEIIAARTF